MRLTRTLPFLGSFALVAACSNEDPALSESLSGDTGQGPNPSSLDEGDDTANSNSNGETESPTSGVTGGQTESGTTGIASTVAESSESTDPDPSTTGGTGTTEIDPSGTTTMVDPSTTSGSTGPDDTTGGPDDTTGGPDDTTGGPGDTTGGVDPDCQAPGTQPPCDQGTSDIFKAIGLNCSDDKSMAIPISNPVIMAPDNTSYRVTTHFGSAMDPNDPGKFVWGPKEGERLLAIGTGKFPALQPDGGLIDNADSEPNNNPDGLLDLPGVMHYAMGSNNGNGGTPFLNCDGMNDCSDTLEPQWNIAPDNEANDVFYMSFDLETPLGTHGYLFDFVYFSEEWPNFVDSTFNDMLVVWSTSETFTGNVTFINDQPLTVTALDPYMVIQPGDPLLAGTGFPNDDEGAATGWFTAKGSAAPGETFTVAITIFDMGDTVWDTVGLIDKFRWDCEGCIPSEVNSCGVDPQ